MWHEPEKVAEWVQEIMTGVAAGWIRPHVDKSFSFEQAGEAHTYMESRRNTGKWCWRHEKEEVQRTNFGFGLGRRSDPAKCCNP